MNKDEMLAIVRQQLTEQRYIHTLRVMETAIQLADRFGADPIKAEIAAIFHDYAKFRDKEEMADLIRQVEVIPKDLLDYHHELWHAPVGAYLVEQEVGIRDAEVLEAIRYHTTGRVGMSVLEKVIYLADYIEPGRQFPGVEEVRDLAKNNLDHAVRKALENTIHFLKSKQQQVYPLTELAYLDLKTKEVWHGD